MKSIFLFVWLVLFSACEVSRSDEFWLIPENQDLVLLGFKPSEDFCEKLVTNTKEFADFQILTDSVFYVNTKPKNPIINSENEQVISELMANYKMFVSQIQILNEDMIEATGGYCDLDLQIPILPYRRKDVQGFWMKESNVEKLMVMTEEFEDYLGSITTLSSNCKKFDVDLDQKAKNITLSQNVIEGMLNIRRLQLASAKSSMKVRNCLADGN